MIKALSFVLLAFLVGCGSQKPRKPLPTLSGPPQTLLKLQQARRLYEKGQYKKAVFLFQRIYKTQPHSQASLESLYWLGYIFLKERQYNRAKEAFLKIANSPFYSEKEAEALYLIAFSISSLPNRDLKLVESFCERALEHYAKTPQLEIKTLKLLVHIYRQQNQHLKAIEALAVLVEKDTPQPYRNIAISILKRHFSLEALTNIVEDPSRYGEFSSWAAFELGAYYWNLHDFKKAQKFLEKTFSYRKETLYQKKAEDLLMQIQNYSSAYPYTIGAVLPLSGKNAVYGRQALRGLQLGLGVFGQERSKFSLSVVDSESSFEKAEKSAYDLIQNERPIAVIGDILGRTSEAVTQVSQSLATPNITFSQKAGLTEKGPFVFRYALTSRKIVEELVRVSMDEKGFKTFAILYPNDPYGVEYANLFWDEVEKRGGEVVAVQVYDTKNPKLTHNIKRLTGTFYIEDRLEEYKLRLTDWYKKQPRLHSRMKVRDVLPPIVKFDALFLPDNVQSLIQVLATLKYQDIKDVTVLGTNLWNTKELTKKGKALAEGVIFVDLFFQKDYFENTKFYSLYKETFALKPTFLEAQAYDVGLILRQLILSGARNRRELSKALFSLSEFPGTFGLVSTSKSRAILHNLKVLNLKKGKIEPLY